MNSPLLFHVDAFTRRAFRGNPAGVVLNADSLSTAQMQDLARELKHSETAFVMEPDGPDHDVRIRYFTPTVEVPLCGHATVAAHFARAQALGLGPGQVRQKNSVGIHVVDLVRGEENQLRIRLHQGWPVFQEALAPDLRLQVLTALGLCPEDVPEGLPLQVVSTGHSKVMVPLRANVEMDALSPDRQALTQLSALLGCNGYFVFQLHHEPTLTTHGRMFAPAIGIPEDPVTGNANGPLGAYLVHHRVVPHDGRTLRFLAHQGRALRRDGVVEVNVSIENGEPVAVSIAGDACVLFQVPLDTLEWA
jgi:PhzF family phenazine biosynthesis protein